MDNITFLIFFVLICFGVWAYRRSRVPDLLNEIHNGLKHLAFREEQRGDLYYAERYKKMAQALIDGQRYVLNSQNYEIELLDATSSLVLLSMDYSLLEQCGINRQNHKHACYVAVGDLANQLNKACARKVY